MNVNEIIKEIYDVPTMALINSDEKTFNPKSVKLIDKLIFDMLQDNTTSVEVIKEDIGNIFVEFLHRYKLTKKSPNIEKLKKYEYNLKEYNPFYLTFKDHKKPVETNIFFNRDFRIFCSMHDFEFSGEYLQSVSRESIIRKLNKIRQITNEIQEYNVNIIILLALILQDVAFYYNVSFDKCFVKYLYIGDDYEYHNIVEYENLIAFHPGSYIEDVMKDFDVSPELLAELLEISIDDLEGFLNGNGRINLHLAESLYRVTNISAEHWLNLQKSYDMMIEQIKSQKEYDKKQKECDQKYDADVNQLAKHIEDIQNILGRKYTEDAESLAKRIISSAD